jgi:hypothetical protein
VTRGVPGVARILAAAAALILCAACTRTVESGRYGPFQIGASKEAALAAIERLEILEVEPRVDPPIRLVNPQRADLDALKSCAGLSIFAEDHPVALNVEFHGELVDSTSPNFGEYPYLPRYPYSGPATLAMMQVKITRGLDHAAVFDAIASFKTQQKIVVEASVPGFDMFRGTNSPPWAGEYRSLLLVNDEWRFEGLKGEFWYPVRHATVVLHFRGGRLASVEHHASLF